jgi:hypothetical protein
LTTVGLSFFYSKFTFLGAAVLARRRLPFPFCGA